jgi:hypothetical protein
MRKPNRAILFSSSIAMLAIGITSTAALAATGSGHAYVSHRTSTTATWSVYAPDTSEEFTNVASVILRDTATGHAITCKTSDINGTFKDGMGLTGAIATVSIDFATCSVAGARITVTPSGQSWNLMASSYARGTNLGVTTGQLEGIDIAITGSFCSADVDGTGASANDGVASYKYYNNPHWFIYHPVGSNLHIYNVSGCAGLFSSGDPINFVGTYGTFNTSGSDVFITSP